MFQTVVLAMSCSTIWTRSWSAEATGTSVMLTTVTWFVRSRAAGERVMASLEAFLCKRLRLKVNREKSAVARPWDRKFVGYSFTSN